MKIKLNITLLVVVFGITLLFSACDEPAPEKNGPKVSVITKSISPPAPKKPMQKLKAQKQEAQEPKKEVSSAPKQTGPEKETVSAKMTEDQENKAILTAHYDSKGKIDPFKPLIQEKTDTASAEADKRPKRILTPLEKIELSQIRLVAVIWTKDRKIAMVEEASGKGYEIGVGTYIGRNQGRVSEIKENSIIVKELVKDFKGRYREKIQEIKLYRNDREE